jgi:hypothetical protein
MARRAVIAVSGIPAISTSTTVRCGDQLDTVAGGVVYIDFIGTGATVPTGPSGSTVTAVEALGVAVSPVTARSTVTPGPAGSLQGQVGASAGTGHGDLAGSESGVPAVATCTPDSTIGTRCDGIVSAGTVAAVSAIAAVGLEGRGYISSGARVGVCVGPSSGVPACAAIATGSAVEMSCAASCPVSGVTAVATGTTFGF